MSRNLDLTNTNVSKINLENITFSSGSGLESVSGKLHFNGEEVGTGGAMSSLQQVTEIGAITNETLYCNNSSVAINAVDGGGAILAQTMDTYYHISRISTVENNLEVQGTSNLVGETTVQDKINFQDDIKIGSSSSLSSIGIGIYAGYNSQGANSIAFGSGAGYTGQNNFSIALGVNAGYNSQGANSIAFGSGAGNSGQGNNSIALGNQAGFTGQNNFSVAIGNSAGKNNQGTNSIAFGSGAGYTGQNNFSIALGLNAGNSNQGQYCIAIGNNAGNNNQADNSIVLNARSIPLNTTASGLFINPIRKADNPNGGVSGSLWYNTTTNEVCYNI